MIGSADKTLRIHAEQNDNTILRLHASSSPGMCSEELNHINNCYLPVTMKKAGRYNNRLNYTGTKNLGYVNTSKQHFQMLQNKNRRRDKRVAAT